MATALNAPQILQADRFNSGNRAKFAIDVVRTDGPVVLRVAGKLDESTACQLDGQCAYWVERGAREIVVDFQSAWLVSSEGVRSLLVLGKELEQAGGRLMLSGVQGNVRRVFQITGLDRLFRAFNSLADYELQYAA